MAPRESGFAEYIVMPERNPVSVPDDVVLSISALTEPIAYGWYAVRKAKAVIHKKDQDIRALVIGGGAIGLGAALSFSAQGIKIVLITEPNELYREYIENHCAQLSIDPKQLCPEDFFDLISDGVGYENTGKLASQHAVLGGVTAQIGLGSALSGLISDA